MARTPWGLMLAVVLLGVAACGPVASSAAPPLVVCGMTLSHSASGAVLYNVGGGAHFGVVTAPSAGGLIFIQVSDSCQSGADVAITPPDAFEVVNSVRASDGRYAAIVLKPLLSLPTHVAASHDGHFVGTLEISLLAS